MEFLFHGKFYTDSPDWVHTSRVLNEYELMIVDQGTFSAFQCVSSPVPRLVGWAFLWKHSKRVYKKTACKGTCGWIFKIQSKSCPSGERIGTKLWISWEIPVTAFLPGNRHPFKTIFNGIYYGTGQRTSAKHQSFYCSDQQSMWF